MRPNCHVRGCATHPHEGALVEQNYLPVLTLNMSPVMVAVTTHGPLILTTRLGLDGSGT